jgi:hypothetical protein
MLMRCSAGPVYVTSEKCNTETRSKPGRFPAGFQRPKQNRDNALPPSLVMQRERWMTIFLPTPQVMRQPAEQNAENGANNGRHSADCNYHSLQPVTPAEALAVLFHIPYNPPVFCVGMILVLKQPFRGQLLKLIEPLILQEVGTLGSVCVDRELSLTAVEIADI